MKSVLAFLAISASLFALPATAQVNMSSVYLGASVGSAERKDACGSVLAGGSCDEKDTAWRLFGGYQITPHFAVEGGAFSLGHVADASGKAKLRGAYADAVGRYEFAPRFSVLGSAGVAEGHFTTSQGDDNSPALKLGAGLQYDVAPRVAVLAKYDHYHFADAFDAKPNVGAVSVGVKVGF